MNNLRQNLILAEYAVKYVESIMSKRPGPFNRPESVVHRVLPDMPPYPPRPFSGPDRPLEPGLLNWIGSALFDSPWVADQKSKHAGQKEWAEALHERVTAKGKEIEKLRTEQMPQLRGLLGQGGDPAENAIRVGALVEQSGIGNCGEQSYVAFKYLVTKGAPGLAIMDWGAPTKLRAEKQGLTGTGNHTFIVIGMDPSVPQITLGSLLMPPNWGENAVICDPWYHEWFQVDSLNDWQPRMKRILGETRASLNEKLSDTQKETASHANMRLQDWKFRRDAYLPHRNPDLVTLACGIGNPIAKLQDMRAPTFAGRNL